jgi:transcriptional regulator with XRE-family HTH domain
MNTERTIGSIIRDLRVAGGWEQKAAAQRVGLSAQYWGDIERDRRIPPPETIERLAAFFKVEPAALLWTWLRHQVGDELTRAMWQAIGAGAEVPS